MQSWTSVGLVLQRISSKTFSRLSPARLRLVLSASGVIVALQFSAQSAYSSSSQAQQPTQQANVEEVLYGRPAQGTIADAAFQQEWLFLPNSKDRITISVDRTGDTLVPALELHDENGNVIAKADHDETYARAVIQNFTLPGAGRYTLVVGRYNGQNGKTFGSYKLVISLLGLGDDGFNATFVEGQLQLSQPRDGTISETKWKDTWAFQTQNADPVTVIVSRIRGTLVPQISLLDSKFNPVASGQPDASYSMAAISKFAVGGSGQQYYVAVSRIDGSIGATVGDYRLLVVQGQQH